MPHNIEVDKNKGVLSFDKILVRETQMNLFDNVDISEKISIGMEYNIIPNKVADDEIRGDFKIEIEDENKGLYIEVIMSGYFTLSKEILTWDKNKSADVIYRSTLSIIFPYLRSYISNITSQSGMAQPIILPTINVNNMVMNEDV